MWTAGSPLSIWQFQPSWSISLAWQPWLSTALCSRTHFQVPLQVQLLGSHLCPDLHPAGTWGCSSRPAWFPILTPGVQEFWVSIPCPGQVKEQRLVPSARAGLQTAAEHGMMSGNKQLCWVLWQILYSPIGHWLPRDACIGQETKLRARLRAKGLVCSNTPNQLCQLPGWDVPPPLCPHGWRGSPGTQPWSQTGGSLAQCQGETDSSGCGNTNASGLRHLGAHFQAEMLLWHRFQK